MSSQVTRWYHLSRNEHVPSAFSTSLAVRCAAMSTGRLQHAPPDGTFRWRFGCVLVAAAAAVTALLAGCGTPAGQPASMAPGTGSSASAQGPGTTVFPAAERAMVPAVSGKTLTGESLALRDLTGKGVVVVNVWASWCTPCREESGVLTAAAAELKDQHVGFVGVDEADSASAARSFVQQSGATYPQLLDPDGAILARLKLLPASGIPSTLVLDGRGRMAARVIGPLTSTTLHQVISAAQDGGSGDSQGAGQGPTAGESP